MTIGCNKGWKTWGKKTEKIKSQEIKICDFKGSGNLNSITPKKMRGNGQRRIMVVGSSHHQRLEPTFQTAVVFRPLSRKMAPAMDSMISPRTFGALQSPKPNELKPGFVNSS